MIKVFYFARLREQLGVGSDRLDAGPAVGDVQGLVQCLRRRGGVWEEAFAGRRPVMIAVNQQMADLETPVKDGDEVAFFPPVTGG